VTAALIILGALSALLLGLSIYLLLRRNPLQQDLDQLRLRAESLAADRAGLASELQHAQKHAQSRLEDAQVRLDEQKAWIGETTQHFETRVLAAATKLMEERGRAFTEQNQKEVGAVVGPFKEQLAEFRRRVDDIYAADTRERSALKAEIVQLTSMNQAMSVQATKLANALTVTSKSTGDWGETILEKILEDSGLRKGH